MDEVGHGDSSSDTARGEGARQLEHRRDVALRRERHEDDGELWRRSHPAGRRLGTKLTNNVNARASAASIAWWCFAFERGVLVCWCVFKDVAARALARGRGI